LDEAHGN